MNRKWIFSVACATAVAAAALARSQAEAVSDAFAQGSERQGLVRLQVPPISPMPEASQQEELDVEQWHSRLSDPDLDLREQAFEQAVAAARHAPRLREALQQWAREEDDVGLAWTARLALRESARAGPGTMRLGGPSGAARGSATPAELLEHMREQLEGMHGRLDELFEELPAGVPVPTPGRASAESLQLQIAPDGVECTVTTEEDGDRVTRSYRAESLEQLLEQHPELRERVQVQGLAAGSWRLQGIPDRLRWRLAPGDIGGPWELGLLDQPVRTDVLGVVVRPLAEERGRELGLEPGAGLAVERVEPGTVADALGVRRGHVLVELNGRALRTSEDISSTLAERPEDGDLHLVLIDRWGQHRTRVWKPQAADTAVPSAPTKARRGI